MLKKRIIPKITFVSKSLGPVERLVAITTRQFFEKRVIGDPVSQARIFENTGADQLLLINKQRLQIGKNYLLQDLVASIAKTISMPVCFAGGINNMEDIDFLIQTGIDKVCLNTSALNNPKIISDVANKYGSQAINICVDYTTLDFAPKAVFTHGGVKRVQIGILDWALECQSRGAGEIILNCINHDGCKLGVDEVVPKVLRRELNIPLILSGGANSWGDFRTGFSILDMDGVAASTFFSETDQNIVELKRKLAVAGVPMRLD